MSQGIEMIGKPLGPQQAGHVLDLKPSQIFVGRRSLTTRHQFFVIVMGLFLAPKNSSFPIFVGSLFPLFVATQSPFLSHFSYSKSPSSDGQIVHFPRFFYHHHCFMLWMPNIRPCLVSICHGLPWSAMVCHGLPWSFSTQVLESMLLNCHLTSYSKVFSWCPGNFLVKWSHEISRWLMWKVWKTHQQKSCGWEFNGNILDLMASFMGFHGEIICKWCFLSCKARFV